MIEYLEVVCSSLVPTYHITGVMNEKYMILAFFVWNYTMGGGGVYKTWQCETWGPCNGIVEYSSLGCHTVSLDLSFPAFQRMQHLHLQCKSISLIHPLNQVDCLGHVNNLHSFKFKSETFFVSTKSTQASHLSTRTNFTN